MCCWKVFWFHSLFILLQYVDMVTIYNMAMDSVLDFILIQYKQNEESVWAMYYHKSSTNKNPEHNFCPGGAESWSKWRVAEAQGAFVLFKMTLLFKKTFKMPLSHCTKLFSRMICYDDALVEKLKILTNVSTWQCGD